MRNFERVLEFDVTAQRITKKRDCDFSNIIAGTIGYLKAKFFFSLEEWGDCRKAASFWIDDKEYAVLLNEDNSCVIPHEVLVSERFFVSVTGLNTNYKITTNKVKVKQEVR